MSKQFASSRAGRPRRNTPAHLIAVVAAGLFGAVAIALAGPAGCRALRELKPPIHEPVLAAGATATAVGRPKSGP